MLLATGGEKPDNLSTATSSHLRSATVASESPLNMPDWQQCIDRSTDAGVRKQLYNVRSLFRSTIFRVYMLYLDTVN